MTGIGSDDVELKQSAWRYAAHSAIISSAKSTSHSLASPCSGKFLALITHDEAERILAALESSCIGKAVSQAKAGMSEYLLTGLLQAPDDQLWWANGRYYRVRREHSRYVKRGAGDVAVMDRFPSEKAA